MRVFMINSFFSVGGPPRIVKGIYDTLTENGDECMLAAAREKPVQGMNTIRIGNKITACRCALLSRLFDCEGFCAKAATKELIRQIECFNPDIIHLHNLHGYYINVEVLFDFLKQYGKPVVWTLHDCWTMTGHCCHFDYIGCDRWKREGCHDCPQTREYPSSVCFDRSQSNFLRKKQAFCGVPNLTIVTVSEWLKGIVKQSFLEKYPVEVIANGIDSGIFHNTDSHIIREEYHLAGKKILLGVAQNWSEKKGIYDFVRLADMLDNSYRLVLIGLPAKLSRSISKKIVMVPQTNSAKELAEWYSVADVFLNLSYEETFGLVTLEALACGTPVVVYDKTAVPEIVNPNCGKIVHAGDVDSVLEAVKIMCKAEYVSYCLQHAQRFDKAIMYNKYLALYQNMTNAILEKDL